MNIESIMSLTDKSFGVVIFVILIYITIPVVIEIIKSPRATINFISNLKQKRIKKLKSILEDPAFLNDDITYAKEQIYIEKIKNITGIRSPQKALYLFDIIKKEKMELTYFKRYAIYIKGENNQYQLSCSWWLDSIFCHLASGLTICIGFFIAVTTIFLQADNNIDLFLAVIISAVYIIVGALMWKYSISRSEINSIKDILQKYQPQSISKTKNNNVKHNKTSLNKTNKK